VIPVIFTVQATPGPRAGAAFIESQDGHPLLLLDLDPVRVWLEVPPVTAGPGVMAAFLRQLARQAARMAQRLEEVDVPAVTAVESGGSAESGGPVARGRGRHATAPRWDAQAGAS
jgi:hypothetical protein